MYLSLQQCHPCTFCSSFGVFLLVTRAVPCSPSTPELPLNSLRNMQDTVYVKQPEGYEVPGYED